MLSLKQRLKVAEMMLQTTKPEGLVEWPPPIFDTPATMAAETDQAAKGELCKSWPNCDCIVRGTEQDCRPH